MNFKSIICIILITIMTFGLCFNVYADENINTDLDDYIVIHNADELSSIGENLAGRYILANHIDISSVSTWEPIGSQTNPFTGVLNGNGFSVVNMKSHNGLFGYINNAKIENLGLINCDITCSTISKVVGCLSNIATDSTITNCFSSGKINASTGSSLTALAAEYTSGGLVGFSNNSSFINCYSLTENILNYEKTPFANMGGLVGISENSHYDCCYNAGVVVSNKPVNNESSANNIYLGDIVGFIDDGNTFVSCYELQNTVYPIGNTNESIAGIVSLYENEMLSSSSYKGFDFTDDWCTSELTTPRLKAEKPLFKSELNLKYREKASPALYGNVVVSDWQSNKPDVAIVSNNEIEAVGKGETTIRILTEENLYGEIKVTVSYTWWQSIIIYFLFGWLWY